MGTDRRWLHPKSAVPVHDAVEELGGLMKQAVQAAVAVATSLLMVQASLQRLAALPESAARSSESSR